MKLVKIDNIEEQAGEYAVIEDEILFYITGSKAGESIDGNYDILPNYSEARKNLRDIFGEGL